MCSLWVAKEPDLLQVDSDGSDETEQMMPRLI